MEIRHLNVFSNYSYLVASYGSGKKCICVYIYDQVVVITATTDDAVYRKEYAHKIYPNMLFNSETLKNYYDEVIQNGELYKV
jgi:regulator of sigma D